MQHGEHVDKHSRKSSYYSRLVKNKAFWIVVVVIIIAVVALSADGDKTSRSESYKKVAGTAGLNAQIDYDCKKHCKQKFDFNVYLFNEDGQQVSVARPDKDGDVRLAMPAGDYVMLIGKRLAADGLFPQEKLTLKNGQQLDLKLQYKENAQ